MPHIVYQTTNLVNNKVYVGVHCTSTPYMFDGYLGSGFLLSRAIKKHGVENFERKTFVITNKDEAYRIENLLVDEVFVNCDDTYNLKIGGNYSAAQKGKHLSVETKAKISDTLKGQCKGEKNSFYGKHHSEETKKKMSDASRGEKYLMFGRHHSEIVKKKMSETAKGRVLSDETKIKISVALKGKHHSEETKKKMSETLQGHVVSEETKKKISDAHKGRKHSLVHRQANSAAHKGKSASDETKKKLSVVQKGRIWINNGSKNKHIKKVEFGGYLKSGWLRGMKHFIK